MRRDEIIGRRYKLVEQLGKGGMGAVWRAWDLIGYRWVAIKVISKSQNDMTGEDTEERFQAWREFLARFRQEALLLGKLMHPGIPEIYGSDTHRGDPYIVMKLVEGNSLNKFYKNNRPFHVPVAASLAYQIAEPLAGVHELHVAHRDIKPANLVLGLDGRVVLVDFGIARLLQNGSTQITNKTRSIGTVGYMSPEQIKGGPIGVLSDMYSFGCVCYELFTGNPPFFPDENGVSINDQHLHVEPLPMRESTPRVPEALDQFVLQLLSKDSAGRPDTSEALRVLSGYLPAKGSPAPRPILDPDPTRPFREADSHRPTEKTLKSRRRSGRRSSYLSRQECLQAIEEASREIEEGEFGESLERLLGLLPRMRSAWGFRDKLYKSAYLVGADGLRDAGDRDRARTLYERILQDHLQDSTNEGSGQKLTARTGMGHCRCPYQGNEAALEDLREAVAGAGDLSGEWRCVVMDRCHELAIKLAEHGYSQEVQNIMPGLSGERNRGDSLNAAGADSATGHTYRPCSQEIM